MSVRLARIHTMERRRSSALFSDSFTGTDGAAPDSTKWITGLGTSGSTATIQSNQLRLVTGTTGSYGAESLIMSRLTAQTNGRITVTATPITSSESYFSVILRGQAQTKAGVDNTSYRIGVGSSGDITVLQSNAGTQSFLAEGPAVSGFAIGSPVNIDVAMNGAAITFYAWTGATRPGSPIWTGNGAVTAAGFIGISLAGGATGAANDWRIDNFAFTTT